jgi:hypothetical protein
MARHCHWHLCSPVPLMAQLHLVPKIICCKKFFSMWITTAAILLNKDQTELSAFHTMFPHARGPLCYWHTIRYLEQQLAEDCRCLKNAHDMAGLQPCVLLFGLDGRAWERHQSLFAEVGGGESSGRAGREWVL